MSNLPWDVLLSNAQAIFIFGPLLSFPVLVFFCLYRLDRIPKLWISGTVILFLISRVLDIATFLWASGGVYTDTEVNPLYQIAAVYLPSSWAMILVQVGVTFFLGVAFRLLWVSRFPPRFWLAFIATFSAMGIVAIATNVLSVFGFYLL